MNDPICPCIFIKKTIIGFAIIAVYVDELNLIRTTGELIKTTNYLKNEFEMKDIRKQNIVSTCRSSIVQMVYLSTNQHIWKKS